MPYKVLSHIDVRYRPLGEMLSVLLDDSLVGPVISLRLIHVSCSLDISRFKRLLQLLPQCLSVDTISFKEASRFYVASIRFGDGWMAQHLSLFNGPLMASDSTYVYAEEDNEYIRSLRRSFYLKMVVNQYKFVDDAIEALLLPKIPLVSSRFMCDLAETLPVKDVVSMLTIYSQFNPDPRGFLLAICRYPDCSKKNIVWALGILKDFDIQTPDDFILIKTLSERYLDKPFSKFQLLSLYFHRQGHGVSHLRALIQTCEQNCLDDILPLLKHVDFRRLIMTNQSGGGPGFSFSRHLDKFVKRTL